MGVTDHLTSLLRSLYEGQEAMVRTRHGTDMVQSWERSKTKLYIVTLLISLISRIHHAKCQVDESQAVIKNLRYVDDTSLITDNGEELKASYCGWKEKVKKKKKNWLEGLKLNIQKAKVVASGPITWWQIKGEKMEAVKDCILGGSKTSVDSGCSHEIKRYLLLGMKAMTNLDSILKKQRHCFAHKVQSSQSYGFPSSHVWMWELDHEEGWAQKIDAFKLWCWRRFLRVRWTARR